MKYITVERYYKEFTSLINYVGKLQSNLNYLNTHANAPWPENKGLYIY